MAARAVLAWLVITPELLIFGTAGFALTLGSASRYERDRLIEGLRNSWRILVLVAFIFSPVLLLKIAADMAQTGPLGVIALIPEILAMTHVGHVWQYRLPLVAALVVIGFLRLRSPVLAIVLLLVSGALLVCESLTSHAIDWGIGAAVVQAIHEASAALWIGSVLSLWFGATRDHLGDRWVMATAPWVSRLAGWTVVVLLLSASFTTYHALMGNPTMLIYTAYGRVLLAKIAGAGTVLLIGAYNRFIVLPDLTHAEAQGALLRNVAIESVLLIAVVGLAALLANTPPAHH